MGTLAQPILTVPDSSSLRPTLGKSETLTSPTDSILGHSINKGPAETINTPMNGRMILSPYDDQSSYPFNTYFVYDSDYRNSRKQ
jgi:hypothetical protein